MSQAAAEKLLAEMDKFSEGTAVLSSDGSNASAETDLPSESLSDFETTGLRFEEIEASMLAHVEDLFALTAKYNRHSDQYVKACVYLDKGIRQLGSACITRAALRKRGFEFPKLDQLTTEKLYGIASFNFRKCDAALKEVKQNKGMFSFELFDLYLNWYRTLKRLKKTETKITDINYSRIDTDKIIAGAFSFTEKSRNRGSWIKPEQAPVYREAPSFPLMTETVRQLAAGMDSRTDQRAAVSARITDPAPESHRPEAAAGTAISCPDVSSADDPLPDLQEYRPNEQAREGDEPLPATHSSEEMKGSPHSQTFCHERAETPNMLSPIPGKADSS